MDIYYVYDVGIGNSKKIILNELTFGKVCGTMITSKDENLKPRGVYMKKRKQIALNRLFNFCILFGLFLAWVALVFITGDEIAFGIVLGVIALILIVLPAIFTPYCYLFDDEGLSLCYLFLPVERYLWKDIYAIEVEDRLGQRKSLLLFFLCTYVFSIYGEIAGEEKFYMRGHIRKSFRKKYIGIISMKKYPKILHIIIYLKIIRQ